MSLKRAASYNGLRVCESCGWPMAGPYEEERHRKACKHVERGNSADALAASLPEVRSTKFGYGTDQLTFSLSKNLSVRFECCPNGKFQLRDVWCLSDIAKEDAAGLVEAIDKWNKTRKVRRTP